MQTKPKKIKGTKIINTTFHLNKKMCFCGDLQEVPLGLLH